LSFPPCLVPGTILLPSFPRFPALFFLFAPLLIILGFVSSVPFSETFPCVSVVVSRLTVSLFFGLFSYLSRSFRSPNFLPFSTVSGNPPGPLSDQLSGKSSSFNCVSENSVSFCNSSLFLNPLKPYSPSLLVNEFFL